MTVKHPDDEIDDIIWSEIGSSNAKGDFICYVIHSLVNAKFLEQAKSRIDTQTDTESLTPVNYFNAIERIRSLAEQHHPAATFHMGKIHALGIAVTQDLDEGVRWYEKAIALGEPRAYANLGWLYQSGYGVPADTSKAFELLSYAGEHGVLSARATVGMMLLKGEGCIPNTDAGLQKLVSAFRDGYLNAGNHLSDLYFEGKYVARDIELAHDWLWKVADCGDERTMAILGHHLITGSHGKTDTQTGLQLMQRAIAEGFLPAYVWLGTLYKKGNGLKQDIKKAFDLFHEGLLAGCKDCEKALALLLSEQNIPGSDISRSLH